LKLRGLRSLSHKAKAETIRVALAGRRHAKMEIASGPNTGQVGGFECAGQEMPRP